ncbi:hypothetical protein FNV43_RR12084 [Rhamnella rubrinervis]|uniref:Uncharacterized protein n=1 Tax=Rhamnella rubrinervis TaxID=2594499 RepID=A0A8K0H782_9ROSA|nr:hypothetical protein FNV43_RR12084 [Rhamnella rubrinervis]
MSQYEFESGTSRMLALLAYLNLTVISVSTVRHAYERGDMSMAGFIIFVYFGYFYSNYCLQQFNRLPQGDESLWKGFLKLNLWVVPSAILLGFAYQLGTFINPILALLAYGVATASSACLFYVYIISGDDNKSSAKINKIILEIV